ncbi:hypothetical protein [Kocuria aegyptia]|uniref:Uncharacterized protein n=1 Tax=Kocuria aegyptia TaxID=330943 RepID=A0ABN2K7C5_9MICC
MNARTPRHRASKSVQTRRTEREAVLALIAIPVLIWFAVYTDNVLLVTLSAIGALIGTWMGRVRNTRRRKHVAARRQ